MTKLFEDLEEDNEDPVTIDENEPLKTFETKYGDAKGIAKALVEKDAFIKRLQRENAEARAEAASRQSVEEKVDQLLSLRKEPTPITPSGNQTPGQESVEKNTLTIADVEKLLAEKEQTVKAETNLQYTKSELEKRYGKDWGKVLAAKAKELGESQEFFDVLAKTRPNVLFNLLGTVQRAQEPSLFQPQGVNTTSQQLQPQATSRTMKYYDTLKKSNPSQYMTPKVQNQLHKDAIAMGPAFFDTP